VPDDPEWEFLAVELKPQQSFAEVADKYHADGWTFERIERQPQIALKLRLHFKRKRPTGLG